MQIVRESTAEQALNGVWGWVDDDLAIVGAWGFDVSDVSVPVLVRYGETDVLVPPAHGEWLAANVPGSQVKIDDVAGHLASDPVQDISENILWLRDGTPPRESERRLARPARAESVAPMGGEFACPGRPQSKANSGGRMTTTVAAHRAKTGR